MFLLFPLGQFDGPRKRGTPTRHWLRRAVVDFPKRRQLEKRRTTADDGAVPRVSHGIDRLSGWAVGLMALAIMCVGGGCARPLTADDPEVKPLLAAMEEVDRAAIGFAPIEGAGKIQLDESRGGHRVAMRVEGGTSRIIHFRRERSGYRWIAAPVNREDHQEQFWAVAVWILATCVFAVIVGTVAALLLLVTVGLLAGLIAAGVVSASVVIGVLRGSVRTGFRALFFQIGGVFGLIVGALGGWTFILLAKLPLNSIQPWLIGPFLGVLFGLLAAWMFNFAWGRSVEWIARKLPGKKVVEVEGERVA